MSTPVVIKGTKSGIIIALDNKMEFDELSKRVAEKFASSRNFLGNAQVAITFEGRELADDEQVKLLDIVSANSDLDVVCIVDNDEKREAYFNQALNQKLMQLDANNGQFYKGNLRSGQVLEFETSIIILGDVNVGAQVVSTGNIVVLGNLYGNAYAGAAGNENAFVLALKMDPKQIRIGDVIARAPDEDDEKETADTKIAFLENGNIYIEPFTRDVLGDIRL